MRGGQLDKRLALYRVEQTKDEAGSLVDEDVFVAEVWGRVLEPRGNEAFQAAQQTASASVRLGLRWRDDVQTTWKFDWNGQRYDITHIDRTERRKGELWLTGTLRTGA